MHHSSAQHRSRIHSDVSFLKSCYQVPVLGAVFNRGANSGFYHWKECKKSLDLFYSDASLRDELFGIIPDTTSLDGVREQISKLSREEVLILLTPFEN